MRSRFIEILVAMLGVTVALCAWFFPFRPIGQSPFDKTTNVSNSPPVERMGEQAHQAG
jgi:hypothetical protein